MLEVLNRILAGCWNRFAGTWQWYALWFMHSKFIIGVSGVITNEHGEVLLLRHRYRKHDLWGLPSGYANRGELLQDALAREIKEETGYAVEVHSLLRVVSGYKLRVEVSYQGEIVGGSFVLDGREVLEAKFFALAELPDGILNSHRQLIALAFPTVIPHR